MTCWVGRWITRLSVGTAIAVVALACVTGLLLNEGGGVLLGKTIRHGGTGPLAANPELDGKTSILDLTGPSIDSLHLPPMTVAITFDDGPDPTWTPQIQAVLDAHGVPGTFFVVGEHVLDHPEVVRQLVDAGHEIGNHSFTHARLGNLESWQVRAQITLTQRAVIGATGTRPTSFRPPYSGTPGYLQPDELAAARLGVSSGLFLVLTDQVVPDYRADITVDQIVQAALPPPTESAVITFHDAGGERSKTVESLDRVLRTLKAEGYDFVRTSEITGAGAGIAPSAHDQWLSVLMFQTVTIVKAVATGFLVLGVGFAIFGAVRCVVLVVMAERNRRRVPDAPAGWFLPRVSVIVPAYNERVGIEAAVRSLAGSDYPDLEVIVVDDGSSDGTAEVVEQLGLANVRVVRQPNGGKPSALNMGLRFARSEIVVMVDGDTIFEPTTVRRLVQPFVDPDVAAVAGNPKVGNRKGFLATLQHLEYTMSSSLERRAFDEIGAMLCIPGAIGAFRRRALTDVGGISAATLAEDTDLTMALARAGWRIAYAPDARAFTEVPTTWRGLYRQRYRWSYGILQAMAKHRRSVIERGRGGILGRRVLPYTSIQGYVAALAAPALDLLMLFALLTAGVQTGVLMMWGVTNLIMIVLGVYALRVEHEPLRHAFVLPLQIVIYRQVLYLVTLRSLWSAMLGIRLPWNSVDRRGGLTIAGGASLDLRDARPTIDLRSSGSDHTDREVSA